MSKSGTSPRFRFVGTALVALLAVFAVPALRTGDSRLWLLTVLVPSVMLFGSVLLPRLFSLDRFLVSLTLYLCALGILAPALSDPDQALSQALFCAAGIAALLAGAMVIHSLTPSLLTSLIFGFLGIMLLTGKQVSPSLPIPVAEAALVFLLISFTSLLSRSGPFTALVSGAAGLALLLAQREIVCAVLWSLTMLLLLWASDGRLVPLLSGLLAVLLLFFGAFILFPDIARIVSAGEAPPLQGLAAAGLIGADTLPDPQLESSISLFGRFTGHYGLISAGLTVLLYLPFLLRGTSVAASARTRFHAVLSMGCTLLLALRVLAAMLSAFAVLPLPAGCLPFLTASLPDLCAELFLAGLLCGVSGRNDADLAEDAHLAMLAK